MSGHETWFAAIIACQGRLAAVTGSQQRPVSAPQNRVPSLFFGALGTSSPNVDDVKHPTALVDHMIDGH